MRRATTPTHTFTFPAEVPIVGLDEILITYSQNGKTILEKTKDELIIDAENNAASYLMSQEESLKFAPEKALIQVRAKGENGSVLASQMLWLDVKPVLNSEEM